MRYDSRQKLKLQDCKLKKIGPNGTGKSSMNFSMVSSSPKADLRLFTKLSLLNDS